MVKMNVITFKRTGHVLGIATTASRPDQGVTAEQIAGSGFRLSTSSSLTLQKISLEIPQDEIGVSLVDFDPRVLYHPHLFALDGDVIEQRPALIPPVHATLDGTLITVTLPNQVSERVDVWCQVSGGKLVAPVIRAITIEGDLAPTDTGQESLTLDINQTYSLALFAPGFALNVHDHP
jgi:hypothetical protein